MYKYAVLKMTEVESGALLDHPIDFEKKNCTTHSPISPNNSIETVKLILPLITERYQA